MKSNIGRFVAIVAIGLGLLLSITSATADSVLFKELSAEWWQWAVSIPASVNPQLDTTGENCFVGQRGFTWFLAGVFGGGTAMRSCSIPEDKALYFPVVNAMNFNTPNVCGQDSNDLLIADMRAASRAFIDGATSLLVELDGKAIKHLQRVRSRVFEVAIPEDNVFDKLCKDAFPAGIYSPAVDDGFYVALQPLEVGNHTLHIHAENRSQAFLEDVTYNLAVVPVLLSSREPKD